MTALEPVWQTLLIGVARSVPVSWEAGAGEVPAWLDGTGITVRNETQHSPGLELLSCATARHEVIEALRWARALIAGGTAAPDAIALTAASTGEYDDLIEAASAHANLPLHFVHGRRALTTRDGQITAALADILLRGLSQDRIRRFVALASGPGTPLHSLPEDWRRTLWDGAPLNTPERFEHALHRTACGGGPIETVLMPVMRLLHRGPEVAREAGETLLSGLARTLWRRALDREAPQAIERALAELRLPDATDPACNIVWAPASELAACPRPYVRLLGLNSQAWPRHSHEDPLLATHLIAQAELDVLPLAEADRRDFRTICATTKTTVVLSYSRRDISGRVLGRSPLLPHAPTTYLHRGRIPKYAMSEADRLMARPAEFALTARARAAHTCWRDWQRDDITPHDGKLRPDHPAILRVLGRSHSATSLQMLLRNPLGFVWRYALGLKSPDAETEPFRLDSLGFGQLTHEILDEALQHLQEGDGLGKATPTAITNAVAQAVRAVDLAWQARTAIPPPLLWHETLSRAAELARVALSCPFTSLPGQRSWSEVRFNTIEVDATRSAPWDQTQTVEIPGAGLLINGKIDRIDISADGTMARVVDYKTGKVPDDIATLVFGGGRQLQRCLYAFAARTLLGDRVSVEAALLYPRADAAYHPLPDLANALTELSAALCLAKDSLGAGNALPGPGTGGDYDDMAFALPARDDALLERKRAAARAMLGPAANIWEAR
jgi:hypothetical protein